MTIRSLTAAEAMACVAALEALLIDAVTHGASIGFMLPIASTEASDYWRGVIADVAAGRKRCFAAFDASDRLIGSAQLALESRPNGRHRAEVQKVLVLHAARGRGIGAALMRAVEAQARADARTLLFLDTSVGASGAVKFYEQLGYRLVGNIPDYARDPDGKFSPNAIFCKQLT